MSPEDASLFVYWRHALRGRRHRAGSRGAGRAGRCDRRGVPLRERGPRNGNGDQRRRRRRSVHRRSPRDARRAASRPRGRDRAGGGRARPAGRVEPGALRPRSPRPPGRHARDRPGSFTSDPLRGTRAEYLLRSQAARRPLPARVAGGATLTDADLIAKRLSQIETCIAELRALARLDELARDVKEERFVEHTLQIAIQAALDVASHIVSDERLGEPRTNRELFGLLARPGILSGTLAEILEEAAGFRNVLVHGYGDVDIRIVRDVVEHRLDDLLAFVASVRRWMASSPDH